MKRLFALLFCLSATVLAVGPKVPCILTWTPSPTPDVTGYWFYWRATNGVYADSQRVAVPSSSYNSGYDLRVLGLPRGIYMVAMSATNSYGESDLSVEATWNYNNPNKPTNLQVQ